MNFQNDILSNNKSYYKNTLIAFMSCSMQLCTIGQWTQNDTSSGNHTFHICMYVCMLQFKYAYEHTTYIVSFVHEPISYSVYKIKN